MNLLAIDTATERCSVAARVEGEWFERSIDTQRGHADLVLSMVDEVLQASGTKLKDLAGIGYGRGPGAFTGVRIAIGVVQGLAFGAQLPTVGISNLAAVAYQAPIDARRVLVCMDARMNEVYWATFERRDDALIATSIEQVSPPAAVDVTSSAIDAAIGSGWRTYPDLAQRFAAVQQIDALPRARDILLLAEAQLREGKGGSAFDAQPVYLRDQVTFVKPG
jgi:tRNA threonylcarbamoyladenosine biosynthesis protein TsaB